MLQSCLKSSSFSSFPLPEKNFYEGKYIHVFPSIQWDILKTYSRFLKQGDVFHGLRGDWGVIYSVFRWFGRIFGGERVIFENGFSGLWSGDHAFLHKEKAIYHDLL
jgi:hypothetical protein